MSQKINTETCNTLSPETKQEIQERLRTKEADKARKLLSQAMSHLQALQIQTKIITKQVLDGKPRK